MLGGYRPQLDGLRFICFASVFVFHVDVKRFWFGGYGVHCFFVLSGFLITGILIQNADRPLLATLRTFYLRRLLRIAPAYYLVLAVAVAVVGVQYPLWHATYLFNVKLFVLTLDGSEEAMRFWALVKSTWCNGIHFWSLCVEEQFYLLFPIAFLLTPPRRRGHLLGASIAASVLLRIAAGILWPEAFAAATLPIAGEYLMWGALAAWLLATTNVLRLRPGVIAAGGAALSAIAIGLGGPADSGVPHFLPRLNQTAIAIGFAAVVVGVWRSADRSALSRVLRARPFVYFGKISYGLYLVHLFTWAPTARWFGVAATTHRIDVALVRLALTLLLGAVLWHVYEGPLNRLKKHVVFGARHA
jgi:peptidoglycan/LPS O-acetylase OafA/YrhL